MLMAILWSGPFRETTVPGRPNTVIYILHCPIQKKIGLNDVYVFGKYNNYALDEENKMTYNEATGNMEAVIKMKQGFYNYKYVMKNKEGDIDMNTISGNFHFTENNYLILVYYRNFGDIYDSIIGVGSANSRSITN